MTQYEILVGEPWDFKGPDGPNRVLVNYVALVTILDPAREDESYLLVKVVTPFHFQSELVEYMVVSPRYVGVTIDEIIHSGGTVGVGRVRQSVLFTENRPLTFSDVEYFLVGSLLPSPITDTGDRAS